MDVLVEILIERVADWPEEAKKELVESIDAIAKRHSVTYRLSDEERAAVERGLEEARQGRFATDEQVENLFNRYR